MELLELEMIEIMKIIIKMEYLTDTINTKNPIKEIKLWIKIAYQNIVKKSDKIVKVMTIKMIIIITIRQSILIINNLNAEINQIQH